MTNENNVALSWDDEIETDGQETIILPEGDYNFEVTEFERGNFPGSAKLCACPKAVLTLKVETESGTAFVKTDIILNAALQFKISSFFRCIGMKKHGEKVVMKWGAVKGKKGRAHFKPRTYTDRDGNERKVNDIERFIDYDEKFFGKSEGFKEITPDEDLPF